MGKQNSVKYESNVFTRCKTSYDVLTQCIAWNSLLINWY